MSSTLTYEATDRYADVNGVKIHYNEAGSGHALICFHGGGPGANAWDNTKHNIDYLAEHFHVILMDMPGFGYSDKDADPAAGESQDMFYARVVKELMDQKGIDKAHLFGSSATGPSVLRFGIAYPDRIGKIILQSSGVSGGLMFQPGPPEGIKSLAVFAENPVRENMVKMMQLFVPRPELLTEEMIDARFKAALIPGHLAARGRLTKFRGGDLRNSISQLKAPVLAVWGHHDRMVPMEGALGCLATIPDVRVHIWGGGAGHFVEYEFADEFSRLITDFLSHP